jgi:hypothetical protein
MTILSRLDHKVMAWLSALSSIAVGAQDQGRLARLQTPLSKTVLIGLLAHTLGSPDPVHSSRFPPQRIHTP